MVIATIPPRAKQREEMRRQLANQTRPPDEVIMVVDTLGEGAAATRNKGIAWAESEFIAFFDDDDIMHPQHLEYLERWQRRSNADLVYPWHEVWPPAPNPLAVKGKSPYKRAFDLGARRQILDGKNFIPIAVLVRRSLMQHIGGFRDFALSEWDPSKCEVLDAWRRLLRAGAVFAHCPHKTWLAVRNGQNTAGLPWKTHVGTEQWAYDYDDGDDE